MSGACAPWRLSLVSWCFLVLVYVGTQCVPSVATRVVAKIYRPFFFVINVYHNDYGVGWLSVTGK